MTEQTSATALSESLSALMDNQTTELELQRLLKASADDLELQATWSRYQLASAAVRGDLPTLAGSDFAARVSAAIELEDTYSQTPDAVAYTTSASGAAIVTVPWWQHLGRAAIAASVAGALVVGVQQYQASTPETVNFAAAGQQVTPVVESSDSKLTNLPSGINAPALSARTVAMQSGYEARPQENRRVMFVPRQTAAPVYNEEISTYVNQLIEEHSDNASLNSGQGMLPFTRVILTEDE
jgi:sigma-E factor negative regulatory protein RseA